ncbi:hypothetical protein BDZ45DRAFT_793254 [Acephala macrosclerotiorum]|nr:hypothetical protein BDZ45DRAFT_793254 [Acephala macrosclerotiorum]
MDPQLFATNNLVRACRDLDYLICVPTGISSDEVNRCHGLLALDNLTTELGKNLEKTRYETDLRMRELGFSVRMLEDAELRVERNLLRLAKLVTSDFEAHWEEEGNYSMADTDLKEENQVKELPSNRKAKIKAKGKRFLRSLRRLVYLTTGGPVAGDAKRPSSTSAPSTAVAAQTAEMREPEVEMRPVPATASTLAATISTRNSTYTTAFATDTSIESELRIEAVEYHEIDNRHIVEHIMDDEDRSDVDRRWEIEERLRTQGQG